DRNVTGVQTCALPILASGEIAVWDRPISPLATGTGVWAITVLVGLVLRGVTGAGGEPGTVPVSFMIVAASLNLITLVGWRIIARSGESRVGTADRGLV